MRMLFILSLLLAISQYAFAAGSPRIAMPGQPFAATVVKVVDGDTITVNVPDWAASPFGVVKVRIEGIDTPETRKPPGKCKAEVLLGKAAEVYAKTIVEVGDAVVLVYRGLDKYARVDGSLTLPDGRDFGTLMIASGTARAYNGGTKSSWCKKET